MRQVAMTEVRLDARANGVFQRPGRGQPLVLTACRASEAQLTVAQYARKDDFGLAPPGIRGMSVKIDG
jgi:hypothetical protein